MRLLIFSPYYPPHRGGLESHSDEFNKYLSQTGVDVVVFTPRLPLGAPLSEIRHTGVHIIRYPAFELIHNYPLPKFWTRLFWIQWRSLLTDDSNMVISRTRFFFPSLMAGYYAWKKQKVWVHIEHGSDFAQFEHPIKNFLGRLYDYTFGRLILKKASFLIANSRASQEFVKTLSGRSDCQVIYRGIEKDLVETAIPQNELRDRYPARIIVGYIGRLIEGKGVKDLIEAFYTIENKDHLLMIIGDGPEQKNLQVLVTKRGLNDRVFFLGAQPLPIAMGHLKTWDIFVNPSYTEGIPTSVVEATILKKAVVATDVGGTSEIISGVDDGILIPPGQPIVLGAAISKLAEDKDLRQSLGQKAYSRVSNKFTWDQATLTYQKFFKSVLESTLLKNLPKNYRHTR